MKFILILLFAFSPFYVSAQPSPSLLTVDEAVQQAVISNPRLSASLHESASAQAGLRSARALANPTFTISPSVPNSNGASDALIFTQPLELNGTRSARAGVASAQLRAVQAKSIVELRDLVFDVKSAYFELGRSRELLSLAKDLLKSAEEFDRIAHRLVELGKLPGINLAQTAIEAIRAQQQVSIAESRVQTANISLNVFLNRKPEDPIEELSTFPAPSDPGGKEALIRQAFLARAEITVEDALRESLLQEARLVRAEGRPDVAPVFRSNEITRSISSKDYGFGIVITLPIFDWGSRRNRIRQLEESARAQSDRMTAIRNQVRKEVEQTFGKLHTAEILLASYQKGILESAKRLLDASRTGLQEGQTSLVAVLEAQRTYRNVQTEYANAQADYTILRAELERATGTIPLSLLPIEPRRSK